MKILMITCNYPPDGGGAEVFCANLVNKLTEIGMDIRIVSNINKTQDNLKAYKIQRIKNKILRKVFFDYYNPLNIIKLKKITEEYKPDILHFHNIYGMSTQLINWSSKRFRTLVTVQDYWPFCFYSTLIRKGTICELECLNESFTKEGITRKIKFKHLKKTTLIGSSNYLYEKLKQAGFTNTIKILNGMEISVNMNPKDNPRLVFIGRIAKEKGIEFLLNTVKNKHELHVFGDGALLSRLKEKYSHFGNITFHGFREDINEEYKKGGILIFPSFCAENLPYVLLEAMAYGMPIIASRIGAMPHILEDNRTALLFDPGNSKDLEGKIEKLLTDKDLVQKLINNAREEVVTKYTWKKCLDEYKKIYSELKKVKK